MQGGAGAPPALSGTIRRQAADGKAGMEVPADAEPGIRRMQSGGEPLPRTVRASMEPAFGQDFGHVRIHRDAAAAGTADAIGARAYTLGNHIAFNRGTFAPRSEEHTSELQSLMRTSSPVFCLKKKKT